MVISKGAEIVELRIHNLSIKVGECQDAMIVKITLILHQQHPISALMLQGVNKFPEKNSLIGNENKIGFAIIVAILILIEEYIPLMYITTEMVCDMKL